MHRIWIVDFSKTDAKRAQSGRLCLRTGDQGDNSKNKRAVFREIAHGPDPLKRALDDAAVDAERGAGCCRGERAGEVGD